MKHVKIIPGEKSKMFFLRKYFLYRQSFAIGFRGFLCLKSISIPFFFFLNEKTETHNSFRIKLIKISACNRKVISSNVLTEKEIDIIFSHAKIFIEPLLTAKKNHLLYRYRHPVPWAFFVNVARLIKWREMKIT